MEVVVQAITVATSRSQVASILSDLNLRQLKEVAKHFDVHIGTATKAVLAQRIEDFTIGAKLRSSAIRSTVLK